MALMRITRTMLLALMLVGCSANPLSLLRSGPNVAANGQAGAENTQTIGVSQQTDFSVSRSTVGQLDQAVQSNGAKADKIDTVNITNKNTDTKLIVILVLIGLVGWLLPSPNEIGRSIMSLVRKEKPRL